MPWENRDLQDLANRIFAAWNARDPSIVTVNYHRGCSCLEASTDGERILSMRGECLVARTGFLTLISGKRYGTARDEQWIIYALAELIAKSRVESRVVRTPDWGGVVWPESLERYWKAERRFERRGDKLTRYMSIAEPMLNAWLDGEEWQFHDALRVVEVYEGCIAVNAEVILAKTETGTGALSSIRYRKATDRFALRECLRLLLDENRIRYRLVRPVCRGRGTTKEKLLGAFSSVGPQIVE